MLDCMKCFDIEWLLVKSLFFYWKITNQLKVWEENAVLKLDNDWILGWHRFRILFLICPWTLCFSIPPKWQKESGVNKKKQQKKTYILYVFFINTVESPIYFAILSLVKFMCKPTIVDVLIYLLDKSQNHNKMWYILRSRMVIYFQKEIWRRG